jgi:hypothetical protein
MCDYSLMEFSNRLAVDGEVLVVHQFPSGSLGLASPAERSDSQTRMRQHRPFWVAVKDFLCLPEAPRIPAVCIPPGARLILHDISIALQRELSVGPDEEVKFVQLSAAENHHRDAVRFKTGQTLRLQELKVGQRVEVIDLGDAEVEEPNAPGVPVVLGSDWR